MSKSYNPPTSAISKKIFLYFVALSIITIAQPVNAQENGEMKATVNKVKVSTGEMFTYNIQIKGEFESPQLDIPKFENFAVVGQSQKRKYFSKKGNTEVNIEITYNLIAINPGTFILKSATLRDNGKKIEAKPITITVTGTSLKEKRKTPPGIRRAIDI